MIQFGVLNKIERNKPYGITRYWAECDNVHVEFDTLEVVNKRTELLERCGEQFANLFKYIESTLLDY